LFSYFVFRIFGKPRSTEMLTFDRASLAGRIWGRILYEGMFTVESRDIRQVGNRYSFFPTVGLANQDRHVAIRSAEKRFGVVLRPSGYCTRHARLQEVKRATNTLINRQHQEAELLAHTLKFADTWYCQASYDAPLPPNGKIPMWRSKVSTEWVRHYTYHGRKAHRLRAGLLLHEISKRLRRTHHVNKQLEHHEILHLYSKFDLLSSHDSTIAAVLAATGQFDERQAPYNSMLIWELHTNKLDHSDATVRVLLNGKPVAIHGCEHAAGPSGRPTTIMDAGNCSTGSRRPRKRIPSQ